jgi:hypothetical protein
MDRLRSRRNSSLRLGGYLLWTMRGGGMHAVTVQSGSQQRWVSHRTILSEGPSPGQPAARRTLASAGMAVIIYDNGTAGYQHSPLWTCWCTASAVQTTHLPINIAYALCPTLSPVNE